MIIGFTGPAGSGKDTASEAIQEAYPSFRVGGFSPLLNPLLEAVDPMVGSVHLSSVLADMSWDEAKRQYPEVRMLQIRMGTAIREHLGEDVLTDALIRKNKVVFYGRRMTRDLLLPGVRFDNEAAACHFVIQIVGRTDLEGEATKAATEQGISPKWVTARIDNSGTLGQFRVDVLEVARSVIDGERLPDRFLPEDARQ